MATSAESAPSVEPEATKENGEGADSSSKDPPVSSQTNEGLRSNLVDLAVKFLSNPRVSGSPMDQKIAFLKKKGLTDAEISQAVKLTGVSDIVSHGSNQIVPVNQAPPLPPRPLTPYTWRQYAVMAAAVGGVSYAVYHFVKNYVLPWFNQRRRQEERLADIQSSVEQLETNIRDMVTSVNDSTKALRDLLSEQQQHLQLLSSQVTALQTNMGHTGSGTSLKEIKDEVSTLKGLMLNRHQFPPTPTRTNSSGIPQWQRAQLTPAKPNGLPSEGSSNGSSPETANKSGLANGEGSAMTNGGQGNEEDKGSN